MAVFGRDTIRMLWGSVSDRKHAVALYEGVEYVFIQMNSGRKMIVMVFIEEDQTVYARGDMMLENSKNYKGYPVKRFNAEYSIAAKLPRNWHSYLAARRMGVEV
jgi:CBS domain-containing protein